MERETLSILRPSSLFSSFALFVLLFVVLNNNILAGGLLDIRTGNHGDHSRVVIELNQPVKYTAVTDDEDEVVILNFLSVAKNTDLGLIEVEENDPILQQVTYSQAGGILSVMIALRTADVQVAQYEMNRPFRVVLDFRLSRPLARKIVRRPVKENPIKSEPKVMQAQTKTAQQAPSTSLVSRSEKKDAAIAEPESSLTSIEEVDSLVVLDEMVTNIPEAVLRQTRPADKIIFKSTGYRAANNRKRSQKTVRPAGLTGSALFWICAAAFLVFNVLLLVMYVNRPARKKQPGKKMPRRKAMGKNQVSPMAAPSPVSHQKAEDEDFMEILHKALGPKRTESMDLSAALKDNARASSQENAGRAEETPVYPRAVARHGDQRSHPPDFRQIASELDLPVRTDGMTEAAAKEQLVGKDGIEFMRNIKRLHLN